MRLCDHRCEQVVQFFKAGELHPFEVNKHQLYLLGCGFAKQRSQQCVNRNRSAGACDARYEQVGQLCQIGKDGVAVKIPPYGNR